MKKAALLLLALGALAARAEAGVTLVAAHDGRLPAGRPIPILIAGLPDDVEELEIFLVPGNGARPLRLTTSLPGAAYFIVTLPSVSLSNATLRLRTGNGDEETWAAESAPFELEASPLFAGARVEERFGEEWLVSGRKLPAPPACGSGSRLSAAPDAPALLVSRSEEEDPLVEGTDLPESDRVSPPAVPPGAPVPAGAFLVPLRR